MYGGVETVLTTLAHGRQLCPAMESHFGVCFEGRLSRELHSHEAPLYMLGNIRVSRPWTIISARAALRSLLARERFDVVVTHMCWPHMLFAPVVRAYTPNLIYWAHSGCSGGHWTERWAARTKPAMVVANSRFVAKSVSNLFGAVRTEVIRYPVLSPLENATHTRLAIRNELGAPAESVVIVQVSRMEAWKGHMLHLDALALLKDVPGWVCWLVGGAQNADEREYFSRLRGHAAEIGVDDRVLFLGQRADVRSLLHAADIFCQPNKLPEPFGIVFIEALSAGLPVVSTRLGGPTEIVDESCGQLVPPGDRVALASALRECVQNRDFRLRMGSYAPARARELCDPATQLQRLYSTFRGLTSSASAPEDLAATEVRT
jgi:glycosyltransferase involved in cell wall biosynthesis